MNTRETVTHHEIPVVFQIHTVFDGVCEPKTEMKNQINGENN